MAQTTEIQVPDIGGSTDAGVIEVLVSEGQTIGTDTPLITLETEKATMDVPSPLAGRVVRIIVKKGDKVAQGSAILLVEAAAGALALKEFPRFNSSLDATGENLVFKKYFNIGFAADTPNGLVVPVIKAADRIDLIEIARELAQLSEKARAGKLTSAEMQGGTFTISSLGGIGGTAFTPIINAPEVAILGVSRSSQKPVYVNGAFVPRLMLPLSLSYDHRVVDGADAARFVVFLSKVLADPKVLM